VRRALVLIGGVLMLAGCGSNAKHTAAPAGSTSRVSTLNSPSGCGVTPRTRRELAKAQADLDKLRAVASRQTRYTYQGTSAMQLATGRFAEDLTNSHLDPFRVNRLIDLGASVVTAFCTACFQMLEPIRPIPGMKYEAPQACG
jgi:hypothetical protein